MGLLAAFLLPGVAQLRSRRRLAGAALLGCVAAAVCSALLALARAGFSAQLLTDPVALALAAASPAALALTALASLLHALCASPRRRRTRLAAASLGLLATLPVLLASAAALPVISALHTTKVEAPAYYPSPLPSPTTTQPSKGRLNVLVLGGDAGPGRWGLRTDSMNLVSVDLDGGATVLIGLPRNLQHAPLPPGPLRERFPDGFTNILNALYPWSLSNRDEVIAALGPSELPGASLVSASVAELTGLPVHGFVLVDMAGFIEVVDVLGGVDVFVPKAVPAPGNVPSAKHPLPDVYEKGWHRLDGTDALGYVRSRSADSDRSRMARQRCVLASLADQYSAPAIARNWPRLLAALEGTLRTNLDAAQLADLFGRLSSSPGPVRSVALHPPLVPQRGWELSEVRAVVAGLLDPASPAPPGRSSPLPASGDSILAEPGCLTRRP